MPREVLSSEQIEELQSEFLEYQETLKVTRMERDLLKKENERLQEEHRILLECVKTISVATLLSSLEIRNRAQIVLQKIKELK